MKKQILLSLLVGFGLYANSYGQTILPKSTIYWDVETLNLIANHDRVNSFQDYCVIDETEIAFIESEQGLLKQFNTQTKKITKSFAVNDASLFMCYSNNTFYVLGLNYLNMYDANGTLIKTIAYTIPQEKEFSVERLVVVKGLAYIHLSDGNTYQLKDDGSLINLSEVHWLFENYKAKTELKTNKEFMLSVVKGNKNYTRLFNIKHLGLPEMDLATAKLIDVMNDKAYLDIELTSENNDVPKRYAAIIDLNNFKLISKTEIPFVYSSYIQNQFKVFNGKLYYSLSATDGIYFYDLSVNNVAMALPANCSGQLHFNNDLLVVNDLEDMEDATIIDDNNSQYKISGIAATTAVTRSNMIFMAYAFRDKTWTANPSNITNYCATLAGLKYRTPAWVTVGPKTSIPYKWGGFTSLGTYNGLASSGKKCGNMATTTSKCGGANHSSASDALIIGLDCSGFVSRCWYQNTKYGTSNISAISSSLGGATTSTPFNSQLRGDIVNKAGSHVRMFVKKNPNGTGLYIEEATGGSLHRVFEASYSRTALYSYIVRRYNGASGLKISGLDEIIENQNEFNFNVFPNVVENETTIHTEVTNYDVTVFNNVGQIVYSQTNVIGNNTINLSEIKAGMYFVNITKDNTKQMFKIIKQ